MEQFAHMQQHQSVANESKVGSQHNIESLAHEAVKHVPNATEFLKNYFSKGEPSEHERFPRQVVKDQIRHLPFGNTYWET